MSQGKHYSKPEDEACFFFQKSFLQKMVNPHESTVTIIIQGWSLAPLPPPQTVGWEFPGPNRELQSLSCDSCWATGAQSPHQEPKYWWAGGWWKKSQSPQQKNDIFFCKVEKGENPHHLYRERFFTQWFYVFVFFWRFTFEQDVQWWVILSQNDGILRSRVMSFRCQPGQTPRMGLRVS